MKITVQVEVPDDEKDCPSCGYNGIDYKCELFGGMCKTPCSACIEARKKAVEIKEKEEGK